ncbi:DNA mismatch repair protein MutL [Oxobacter pfennigii]|uniref:DNA mismatch repair protein MutL n=1 Tax=Oxobacter pfennigii TaxID=36849 RepID=A0A0P8W839_9CLOT|nr:DNA mismatch repair endonuclease MutL [Oxobacter pfennigii]KPU44847.1 DNA mismatch repair protein MutL [Oxobacter pfennigii]
MGNIHILNENISNKIAAGEVVERPSSVVKELVENSIDADATSITVEIKDGGITYLRVTDNGTGMDYEDAEKSFIRHATSKIAEEDDLNNINTLGFRGEALASIAAVSQVEMITKPRDKDYGTKIILEGGECKYLDSTGCPNGTSIIVKNLFYNTPARLKFLKKESRESALVSDTVLKLALSHPEISFKYINNGKNIFNTPGDGDLKNTILTIYGREFYDSLIPVSYTGNILSIKGYIGRPSAARSNRSFQTFFINNRYVKNKMFSTAVDTAYKTFLTVNKFAFCILFISIHPELVDVNVHPTKAEVRFQDEREVFGAIFNTVRNGLAGEVLIPQMEKQEASFKVEQQQLIRDDYSNPFTVREQRDFYDIRNEDTKVEAAVTEEQPIEKHHEAFKEDKVYSDMNVNAFEDEEISYNTPQNLLPPLVIIGQCHFTYILAQGPDGLYIVDQHAAHERILYERYKSSFEKGVIQSQQLIAPFVVELTLKEVAAIKDNPEILTRLGFDFEFFGNNSVMLRSAPMIFGVPQLKKLFLELVDLLNEEEGNNKGIIDSMMCTMACKSAVKANDKLSILEMEGLINKLRLTPNPYTCPHGRPVIIKLTQNELEKKFKRIQ